MLVDRLLCKFQLLPRPSFNVNHLMVYVHHTVGTQVFYLYKRIYIAVYNVPTEDFRMEG